MYMYNLHTAQAIKNIVLHVHAYLHKAATNVQYMDQQLRD